MKAIWIALHYGPKARVRLEPPCTEPYAGWCGTRELITPGDPIRLLRLFAGAIAEIPDDFALVTCH